MAHTLYVIGNGFDLFHGLKTKYSDFKKWMYYHHPIVLDELIHTYNPNGEWWNDFEMNLGNLDIVKYRNKHHSKLPDWIEKEIIKQETDSIPNLNDGPAPSGIRLRELYKLLDICFKEWVKDINHSYMHQLLDFPTKNAKYLSFNYTTILEDTYRIHSDNILHIHGCIKNNDRLIFGHNTSPMKWEVEYETREEYFPKDTDMMKVEDSFGSKEKYPSEFISRNYNFFDFLPDVIDVFYLGFSFSPVDDEYAFFIRSRAPKAMWHISWYREEDKTQIKNFLDDNPLEFRHLEYEFIRINDLAK